MKIKHNVESDGTITSTCGDWVMYHPEDAETVESANYPYSGGEDKPADLSDAEFVGLSFHLLQQIGGKLTYRGREVEAEHFEDTNGGPVTADTELVYDGTLTTYGKITGTGVANESTVHVPDLGVDVDPARWYVVSDSNRMYGGAHNSFDTEEKAELWILDNPNQNINLGEGDDIMLGADLIAAYKR